MSLKKNAPFGRWIDYCIGILVETAYVAVLSITAFLIILLFYELKALGWF